MWTPIEYVENTEWPLDEKLTFETIMDYDTFVLCPYYSENKTLSVSGKQLWYSESREFLLSKGILPLNDLATSGKDACLYEKLFWDENLYQTQHCSYEKTSTTVTSEFYTRTDLVRNILFKGTNSPVLLTRKNTGSLCEITLWCINTVKNLEFRGYACGDKTKFLSNNILYVRPSYRGEISQIHLDEFLKGIPKKAEIDHNFDPLPLQKTI